MKAVQYHIARSNYLARINIYFKEMFPVPLRLAHAVILYASFTLMLEKVLGGGLVSIDSNYIAGVVSLFLITLILRLMDELKDRQTDADLFPGRPVSSGRVHISDIVLTLYAAMAAFLAINLIWGTSPFWAIVVLCYCLLMFRYFFIPYDHRNKLLLNLATHNPVVPLILVYIIMINQGETGVTIDSDQYVNIAILVVMFWSMLLGWELSRKVRYPVEETDYVTYSRIFGFRRATLIAGLVQATSSIVAIYFFVKYNLSIYFLVFAVLSLITLLFVYIKFVSGKCSSSAILKTTSEIHATLSMLAIIVELRLERVLSNVI